MSQPPLPGGRGRERFSRATLRCRKRLGTIWMVSRKEHGGLLLCNIKVLKIYIRIMNRPSSKTINSSALIGKLKRFNSGVRRFFELASSPTASRQDLFEEFNGDLLDRREVQTYPQWKVQTCFRNLNRHQRKRSKQRKIYILPIGPFPEVLWRPLPGMEVSIFDLIVNFTTVFFHGMTVKRMDEIPATELNCKKRIHHYTGKLQLLVIGKLREC